MLTYSPDLIATSVVMKYDDNTIIPCMINLGEITVNYTNFSMMKQFEILQFFSNNTTGTIELFLDFELTIPFGILAQWNSLDYSLSPGFAHSRLGSLVVN